MENSVRKTQKQPTGVLLMDGRADFAQAVEGFLLRQPELKILGVLHPREDPKGRVESLHPTVVLIDLDAPGLDSLQIIGRLREVLPRVGIVAMSLSEDNAHRQAALDAGADVLVYKAHLVQDLMPAIQQARRPG